MTAADGAELTLPTQSGPLARARSTHDIAELGRFLHYRLSLKRAAVKQDETERRTVALSIFLAMQSSRHLLGCRRSFVQPLRRRE
jgi:hypothetical protein